MRSPRSLVLASLTAAAVLPAGLHAQTVLDSFTYPNGTTIPGWTQQLGSWQVQNGRISVTTSGWSYITRDGIAATRSVIDGEFFYAGSGIQFGGLTSRHPGGALDSNLLMVKIQDNGATADFDRIFSYERGATGNTYADIPGGTQSAYCRMITLDTEFWMEVDADKDGIYEQILAHRPITLPLTGTLVGMNAYGATQMDNFEFFDAVLLPQTGAVPHVGSTYNLDLKTGDQFTPWFGMLALGNSGFAIGNRAIPVSPDFLATGTFANSSFGMVGVTDGNGDSVVSIPIPAFPAIVGLHVFASTFTIDGSMPFGVGKISNEHGFVLVP